MREPLEEDVVLRRQQGKLLLFHLYGANVISEEPGARVAREGRELGEDLLGAGNRFAVVDVQAQIGLQNRAEEAKGGGTGGATSVMSSM